MKDNELYVNSRMIVKLNNPFRSLSSIYKVKNVFQLQRLFQSPKEVIDNCKSYNLQVSNKGYATLFCYYEKRRPDYPRYWIYNTNGRITPLFRDKAISQFGKMIGTFPDQKDMLITIIDLLAHSYSFDCIVTDIDFIREEDIQIPVVHDSSTLRSYKRKEKDTLDKVMTKLLVSHSHEIPVRVMYDNILDRISLSDTNFDLRRIRPYSRILVLVMSNFQYAKFLWHHLKPKEVMPVVLFNIEIQTESHKNKLLTFN